MLQVWTAEKPHPQEEVREGWMICTSPLYLKISLTIVALNDIISFLGHSQAFLSIWSLFQYLDCLWAQIQKLKKDRWQERHILRPYIAFDSVLCEALQHNLPPFTPPGHMPDAQYPMPRVVFRMFDYTDAPEVRCSVNIRTFWPNVQSGFIWFDARFPLCPPPGSCYAWQPFCGEICNWRKPALYHQNSLEREENMVGNRL